MDWLNHQSMAGLTSKNGENKPARTGDLTKKPSGFYYNKDWELTNRTVIQST
jgi:hypothetical protein